jgi:hypothetical protein
MTTRSVDSPRVALIEAQKDGSTGAVVIARIANPQGLLAGRTRRFHDDIVDSLVELTIGLLDEEFSSEGANR